MSGSPRRNTDPFDSRPYGSSAIISIVVVAVVMAILVIGSIFVLNGLNDDDAGDDDLGAIPSPSGTSELVAPEPTATDTGTSPTAPNNASPTAGDSATSPTATEANATPTEPEASPTEAEPTEELPTETETELEPTATDEPAPEPTDTVAPEPDPTELPLEGAFGFLPPAQLPSGGVGTTLSLEYQLGLSLESLPTVGTVYRIVWPAYTLEDVELARDRLGLQAPVVEEGVGVYRVESDRGTLFVSPTEIIFRAAGFTEGSGLPDDATAIAVAREWVDLSAFISGPMDAGEVVGRDEDIERVVVKFRPVEPQPNLAPNPAATVNIGPGSTVLEVRIAWPAEFETSQYGFSNALDLWREVQNGQGYLEADISSIFATGELSGVATIVDYTTAYTLAGNPSSGQFLVPLISFHGTARIDQTGDEIPVSVTIPVVYFQEGTAG